jgi:hypothetical protein
MNTRVPESYGAGVRHIESMNVGALREWLHAELHEKVHMLSGQADDFPVQAIVNHHPYLTIPAQKRMADAIEELISEWKREPEEWSDPAALRALLSLAAELRVLGAKAKLESLIESGGLSRIDSGLHPAIFRAIAALSSNSDSKFWFSLPGSYPAYAGMAFQVLARIAPKAALLLLRQLPANQLALDGVARKLPDFVSKFEPEQREAVLDQIANAFISLPSESASLLQGALEEHGFKIRFPAHVQERKRFLEHIIVFVKGVSRWNELEELYAEKR